MMEEPIKNVQAISQLCRICLKEGEQMQNIFESSFHIILVQCASITIEMGDDLPDLICLSCINKMHQAYSFKQLCETSNNILRNMLERLKKGEFVENLSDHNNSCLYDADDFGNEENFVSKDDLENDKIKVVNCECKTEKRILESEIKTDTDDENAGESITCNYCRIIIEEASIEDHFRNYHPPDQSHFCNVCNKKFSSFERLKRHLHWHSRNKQYECSTCGKGFYGRTDLKIHERQHTGEKPISCKICAKAFSDPRGLASHLKTHTGEKPYKCDICEKSFAHVCTLNTHKRTHTAERPYVCTQCGSTFKYTHNLIIHMRQHTGERPYHCRDCPKTFSSSEKDFMCQICFKVFATKKLVKQHLATHTGVKPFSCSICNKSFLYKSSLTTHKRVHLNETLAENLLKREEN
ncbi:hypothetical protein NQ318_010100 [Aromia moschata]|uniref:Uncharacterized protein n=1 Tax=Aromia moschata TaxID=1265417 RepID=A0AAV8Y9F6_9CUCU|nr:hypothetical protein NQ318_010100 [Aromia moschata]